MTKYRCSICEGSGKVDKVFFKFKTDGTGMETIYTGDKRDCPGCDGSGDSYLSKVKNGEVEAHKPTDINKLCENAVKENPKEVELYKSGKTKVIGKLIKAVLVASSGKADPKNANTILKKLLEN